MREITWVYLGWRWPEGGVCSAKVTYVVAMHTVSTGVYLCLPVAAGTWASTGGCCFASATKVTGWLPSGVGVQGLRGRFPFW